MNWQDTSDRLNIVNTYNRLESIHKDIKHFEPHGQLLNEIPEQLMACAHIQKDDCVLELGGSCGRNSCVINYLLDNKKNQVVIEPSRNELNILTKNRDMNNFEFQIKNCAISSVPLYSKGWLTHTEHIPGSVEVQTVTYDELKNECQLEFNVIVIDNEGHFVKTLKDFPAILNNIRLIIIEHDFNSIMDCEYFKSVLENNGFKMKTKILKSDKYAPGDHWGDGVFGDPVFVSAWVKILKN